jgi:hypothetical protein
MDFKDYTNLLKAVIHFNNNVPSFYVDLMMSYDGCMGLLKMCLYKDEYETTFDVKHRDNISIFRIKIFNVSPSPNMLMPKESRLMFSGFGDTISKRMNMYMNSSSTDIVIGNSTVELSQVPIDITEEEIFQLSTLASVPDYSDYVMMREHYHHFSEFCPPDYAISIAENKEELNDIKLKDYCTQKVWGLLNLA